jgi:hypothetical protein
MKDKDNLNNFFRKNLEDYSPDASWNVPNDDVFINAIETVNKDSKPNRKLILLFLFFGFIAAFTLFEINRENKIDSLETTIVNLEEQIEELNHQNNEDEENIMQSDNSIKSIDQNVDQKHANSSNVKKEIAISNSSPESHSITHHQIINDNLEVVIPEVDPKVDELINDDFKSVTPSYISSLLSKPTEPTEESLAANPKNILRQLLAINQIPKQITSLLGNTIEKNIDLSPYILDKENINHNKWTIGAAFINNISWLSMTNVPAASENALTAYDQTHHCSGFKIAAEYQINKKLSVYGDVGYEGYKNQSDLNTDFFYDEKYVNSNDIFETEIDLLNPLGDFSSLATFRVHASMNQNDVIVEETKIKQSLNVLTLKSGINYTLFDSKKVFAKVGLGVGIAAKTKLNNEFNVSLYNNNELMTNYSEETESMKGVNNFFIMGEAKATLGYKLSDKFNITLESAYNRSLSSLRDSAPANGPQTYLHALSLSTGISYNF